MAHSNPLPPLHEILDLAENDGHRVARIDRGTAYEAFRHVDRVVSGAIDEIVDAYLERPELIRATLCDSCISSTHEEELRGLLGPYLPEGYEMPGLSWGMAAFMLKRILPKAIKKDPEPIAMEYLLGGKSNPKKILEERAIREMDLRKIELERTRAYKMMAYLGSALKMDDAEPEVA